MAGMPIFKNIKTLSVSNINAKHDLHHPDAKGYRVNFTTPWQVARWMFTHGRKKIGIVLAATCLLSVDALSQCGMVVDITANPPFPWNLCPGVNIVLTSTVTGGVPPYTYMWSDGATTPNTTVIPPYSGNYFLMVTDSEGCVEFGEIHIKASVWDVQIVFAPTPVCVGDSMPIFAYPDFPPGTSFIWSTGETTNPIWIFTPGSYSLTATAPSGDCSGSATASVSINYWPEVMPVITGPAVLCSGQSGTLTAAESPDFYYTWSTGDQTQSISINAPGIYSVTVDNGFGCLGFDTYEVLPGTDPPDITAPPVLCGGQSGTVAVTNASSYTSFVWNTGATTSSITINSPGTYSVTVTATGGCMSTGSVTVTAGSSGINVTGTATPQTACSNPNGSVDITPSPSGSYTYAWSNGATTQDINGLGAGNYSVTVTDNGGCTSSASFTVTTNVVYPAATGVAMPASCSQNNGSIDLSVMPAGTYTYLWSSGATSQDLVNVAPGPYTVTVTSAQGCSDTTTITVPNNTFIPAVSGNVVPYTSCSTPNGSIDILVTPGGTYTYTWSNGGTTEDISSLIPGTYTVTVSAGGSCLSVVPFVVPDSTILPIAVGSPVNDTCSQNTGSIDLTVSPSGSYTFAWSNGAVTEDISDVPSGIYSVTVTSVTNGCVGFFQDTLDNVLVSMSFLSTITSASCGLSNGSIDLTVTPPGTYAYAWSNGSTTEDLSAIPAGSYSITVTTPEGCSQSDTTLVPDNPVAFTIAGTIQDNTACAGANGSVDIAVTPPGSYSYQWSNGATSADISNLSSGLYTVTVTLGITCIATQSFQVDDDLSLVTLSGIPTPNSSCAQPDGAIDLTVQYMGAYTILWSNGETTEDLQDLSGGTYSVTVTGDNGCTAEENFNVVNANATFSLSGQVLPNQSCASPDGSIDLSVSPAGIYTYSWTNGASTQDIASLSGGVYGVTVTDLNNCALTEVFVVADNLVLPVITALITESYCGTNTGSIDLSILPAAGNTYQWSNGSTDEDLGQLFAGTYGVTVTGSNGCTAAGDYAIPDVQVPIAVSAQVIPSGSCSTPDGSIDLSVNPAGIYFYAWSNGPDTEDQQGLSPGTYTVTVTNSAGCMTIDTFTVLDSAAFPFLSAVLIPAHCGANDGGIDLSVLPPAGNMYYWSQGSLTEDLLGMFPGTYSVTVTAANGCVAQDSFLIDNINTNFSVSAVTGPDTACLLPTGFVDLTVIPAGTYSFTWDNGSSSEDLSGLTEGMYAVTISDSTGCASYASYLVQHQPDTVVIAFDVEPSSCGQEDGAINLTATPASGNTFLWSNGAVTEDVSNLTAGMYTVTVTGSNGCMSRSGILVPGVGASFSVNATVGDNTGCNQSNGFIDLAITPAATYSFNWSDGPLTEDRISLAGGSYYVTITDLSGCTVIDTIQILDLIQWPELSAAVVPATCGNSNGQVDLSISPVGIYTVQWSNGQSGEDLVDVVDGTYGVTVTDGNGCSTDTFFVVQHIAGTFSIEGQPAANNGCTAFNGSIELTITPAGNYVFAWSNGAITEDLHDLAPGVYSVTVYDENLCFTSDAFTVADQTTAPGVSAIPSPATCGQSNGRIDLTVSPASGNDFLWSNGQTSEDLADLSPGQYQVTVTDLNGCSWSGTFDVSALGEPVVQLDADLTSQGPDSVTLTVGINVPVEVVDTVLWFPPDLFFCLQDFCLTQTIAMPPLPVQFRVMVIDTHGCAGEARLVLNDDSTPAVYIPNVFTPNQDGVNDFFTVYGDEDVELVLEMRIFDRWGNLVFIQDDFLPNVENYGWNGEFRSQPMNPAVFAYWARVLFRNGSEGFFKGDVTLLR